MVEWPETTVCYTQDNDGWCIPWAGTPIFDGLFGEWVGSQEARIDRSPIADGFELDVANDHSTAIVTREMWEAERAKVKGKTEWDGEGLPPVGAKCEARALTNISEFKWIEVKVEFISEKGVFLTSNELTGGCIGLPFKYVEFRPFRTPEQIAAKERENAVKEMMETVCKGSPWTLSADAAAKLYDAGYRKIVAKK